MNVSVLNEQEIVFIEVCKVHHCDIVPGSFDLIFRY